MVTIKDMLCIVGRRMGKTTDEEEEEDNIRSGVRNVFVREF